MKNKVFILLSASLLLSGCKSFKFINNSIIFHPTKEPNFSVSLSSAKGVDLVLLEKLNSNNRSNYYEEDDIKPYREYTYSYLLPFLEPIDSEETDCDFGANIDVDGNIDSLNFFKYTFYIKNNGPTIADYDFRIKIADNKLSSDGRSLDEIVRVMLFENDAYSNNHDYYVYAKKSNTTYIDKFGEPTNWEPISTMPEEESFYGFAIPFESDSVVGTFNRRTVLPNEVMRYTIVFWLEGMDPDSNSEVAAPVGASLKFGIEINGYEND